ncbi:hypothetical protein EXIGLDRAFT_737512 [Exidia glandulosa HHB12029]|uniref:Uncharacterized protein n=1 Tax=Exidia glandulosa HHB12029 TaxID=1314781 RepID=A0A165IYS5_EXIGL|nr:hypothetical protein EXIGLDRAFT_737512 [Exidia glandulosa HHB12029]
MSHKTASSIYTPAELSAHKYFKRITRNRKSRWWCSLCSKPEQAAVANFDCRGAKRHEDGRHHQEALERDNQPAPAVEPWVDLNSWGMATDAANASWGAAAQQTKGSGWGAQAAGDDWGASPSAWDAAPKAGPSKPRKVRKSATPFADLRTYEDRTTLNLRDEARRKYDVRVWLKTCVLADGGVWVDTEEDVEPPAPEIWWDVEQRNDNNWARTPTNPSVDLVPHGDVASDEQEYPASEARRSARTQDIEMDVGSHFSEPHPFVQRIADDEGWDPATTRHRNEFYTLPTKEKVAHINEMIRLLATDMRAWA